MSKISKIMAIMLLVFGFFLAIAAFLISKNNASETNLAPAEQREKILFDVVFSKRDLPAGYFVTAEDVVKKTDEQKINGSFDDIGAVVGRTTAHEIKKDAVLQRNNFLEGVAGLIAEGERAVSIKVDEVSAVGHKIKPGDWVDLFVVLKRDGQEVDGTQARMLLPRKKVIAYGSSIYGEIQDSESKDKEKSKGVARTAVIAVKVEEVNRLLLAEQQGQVQLALRSPLDQNEPSADMLRQLPGLNVRKTVNQDVSDATAAINDSLAAIKFEDLAKDVGFLAIYKVAEKQSRIAKKSSVVPKNVSGVAVEVIRGNRKETVRY